MKLFKSALVSLCLCFSAVSSAAIITYDITVTDGWFDTNGNPFGMPLSPTLTGTISVDNVLETMVNFELATGSKTWDETEIDAADVGLTFSFGELIRFSLDRFETAGGYMYIFSSNTMAVGDPQGSFNACNGCVSFQRSSTPPTPAPEPSTLAVFALGLLGVAVRRFKR